MTNKRKFIQIALITGAIILLGIVIWFVMGSFADFPTEEDKATGRLQATAALAVFGLIEGGLYLWRRKLDTDASPVDPTEETTKESQ